MPECIVKVAGIKKYFGGVKALDGVDLEIRKGEVHCLAGENGCGKSTLINIISGFYSPDAGTVEIDGVEYTNISPKAAISNGIQVIYQDLSVFPNLTVMENLALNMEVAEGRKFYSKKRFRRIAEEALAKIGFQIDLDEYVENLTVGDKQMIAICRALLNNAKLIIMDEPTTAITKKEIKSLFKVIRQLQSNNIAVLFVSHKLDEVFEIADSYTIFRNGKNVATGKTSEMTQDKFTYYMTGREISEAPFAYQGGPDAETVLEVKNLSLKDGFEDISFAVKKGEILGITGLLGSGRTELVQAIFGYHCADSGEILVEGEPVKIHSIKDSINLGIGYVPPDRLTDALFFNQPICENITIEKWQELKKNGLMSKKKISEETEKWVEELSIALSTIHAPVGSLSGGNQQKCMLARWLALDLKVLILNGPTVGVDIGAKFDIYKLIRKLAQIGLTVIIISDDLPEIISNCNRVLVMRQGRVVSELPTENLTEATLLDLSIEA